MRKALPYILLIIAIITVGFSGIVQVSSQLRGGTIVIALISEPTAVAATSSWNGGFIAAQVFETLLRFLGYLYFDPLL